MAENVERTGTKAGRISDVPAAVRHRVEEAIAGSYGTQQEPQLFIVTIHGPSHTSDWQRYVVQDNAGERIAGSDDSEGAALHDALPQSVRSGQGPGTADIMRSSSIEPEPDAAVESLLAHALDSVRRSRMILTDTAATLDRMSGTAHEIAATYRVKRTL